MIWGPTNYLGNGGGSWVWNSDGSATVTMPAANPGKGATFTTGAATSGNNAGGDVVYNLGAGSGTGRFGQFQTNVTVAGAPTIISGDIGTVVHTLNFTGLTADYGGAGLNTEAVTVQTFTDTSAFSYHGKVRATLTTFTAQSATGSTIDRCEVAPHLFNVNPGADGTLTFGYAVSGELLHSSNSYPVVAFDAISGEIHLLANGSAGTVSAINATVINTLGTTGTYTTSATGVRVALQNNNAQTWPLAYGVDSTIINNATGVITAATGYRSTLSNVNASGSITTGTHIWVLSPSITAGQITTAYGLLVSQQFNTNASTSTNGGFAANGIVVITPNQGGNTSGTDTNYGQQIQVGGGASGVGGTVNNYGLETNVPNPVAAGTNLNIGLRIHGAGGSGGTTTNYALLSDSSAQSIFNGPMGFGGTISSARSDSWATVDLTFPVTTTYYAVDIIGRSNLVATLQAGIRMATVFAAGANTVGEYDHIRIDIPTFTSGTLTRVTGLFVGNMGNALVNIAQGVTITVPTNGTANAALVIGTNSPANGTWSIYSASTAASEFFGDIRFAAGAQAMTAGFLYIPGGAGAPSGVPAIAGAGLVPLYFDQTNLFLYAYTGGAWKKSTVYA